MQLGVPSVEYKRNSAHSHYFNSETGLRRVFVSTSKDGSPSGIKKDGMPSKPDQLPRLTRPRR